MHYQNASCALHLAFVGAEKPPRDNVPLKQLESYASISMSYGMDTEEDAHYSTTLTQGTTERKFWPNLGGGASVHARRS